MSEHLIPQKARIAEVIKETPDVKTFQVEFPWEPPFDYMPGQCAMLSMPGVGEAMFSITSSPTREPMEFAIKKIGRLTDALHRVEPGQEIGIRGPYGNGFPVDFIRGSDLLFIGGGIGLAPLRSLINYCFDHRADYGYAQIVYGARSPSDLVFKEELFTNWPEVENVDVDVTVDAAEGEDWDGPVGFVPPFLEELDPDPAGKIAFTCGPPIMIKFVVQSLDKMEYEPDRIITTLEKRMKCGVGKCGRCNVGTQYICIDGPVFTMAQLERLPDDY